MSDNCMVTDCDSTTGLAGWERIARPEELEPGLPPLAPGDFYRVLVMACGEHAIAPELRAGLHEATCTAPPTCNCTPVMP